MSLVSRAAQSCSLNRCFDKSFGFYILSVLSQIGHSALPAFRECYGNFIHTNPTIKNPRAGHLVRQPIQVGLIGGEGIHLSGLQHFFTGGNTRTRDHRGILQFALEKCVHGPALWRTDANRWSINSVDGRNRRTSGNEVAVLDDEQRFSEVQDTLSRSGVGPKKARSHSPDFRPTMMAPGDGYTTGSNGTPIRRASSLPKSNPTPFDSSSVAP